MVALVTAPQRFADRVRDFHKSCVSNPNLSQLSACDILQAIPQTEVWVAAQAPGNGWAVGPAKFCGHELALGQYPSERLGMRAGEASRLARRWGEQLPPGHPAFAEVEYVAQRLGVSTRSRYVVVGLQETGSSPRSTPAQDYDLADLIAGITDANRHDPADFGPPVGQEAW